MPEIRREKIISWCRLDFKVTVQSPLFAGFCELNQQALFNDCSDAGTCLMLLS